MKIILLLCILSAFLFSKNENQYLMNSVKQIIQKEEYIALAINKYILQTGKMPISDDKFDWTLLETDDYLGSNFNKINPLSKQVLNVYYNSENSIFIKGAVDDPDEDGKGILPYNKEYKFLYNLYAKGIFRVNTLVPINTEESNLEKGSSVIYSTLQKKIVSLLNDGNKIILDNQECERDETIVDDNYYYELKDNKLIYMYCKNFTAPKKNEGIAVYQKAPIYIEDINDLKYIKTSIDGKIYVKNNDIWYEYYYQGDSFVDNRKNWIPKINDNIIVSTDEYDDLDDLIISYIPNSKDLLFRQDGGCMLANGDIFCWGNNSNSKVGIEGSGQIDTTLSPDYVNIPVMLKVQINDVNRSAKKWYNNPYRVKFEKMSMNSQNVCGISPIFLDGTVKIGGDLYCNGSVNNKYFENVAVGINTTSILKRNILIAANIDLRVIDIALVEDAILVLSDTGDLYTFGKNYDGILGKGSTDNFSVNLEPTKITSTGTTFSKIFGLRDSRTFAAIDINNNFWIWGNRKSGGTYNQPTKLATPKKFDKDAIFVNTEEFILKELNGEFYQTTGDNSIKDVPIDIPNTAISVAIFGDSYLYINEKLELQGSVNLLKCRESSEASDCSGDADKKIFSLAFNKLNAKTNSNNGKYFASFSNVGIFKLDRVLDEQYEDFENGTSGWTATNLTSNDSSNDMIMKIDFHTTDTENQLPATSFLGRFPTAVSLGTDFYEVSKTYSFDKKFKNHEIEIEFDFYEIDTWDGERFEFYANDELIAADHFIFDWHATLKDTNITGTSLQDNINTKTGYAGDQSYRYKLRSKLDNNGKVTLRFRTNFEYELPYANHWSQTYDQGSYNEDVENESWGIDNIKIKVKETNKKFVCGMTGFGSKSQMYCWGNVARSIPILSTSLYNMAKINSINKLLITEEKDREEPMSYDNFNNNGNLHLKFPTYIGGFDYEFYFK
jgi:hypothetical protein